MRIFLLLAFLSFEAQALNRTFLNMPRNREYMNFVLSRYLSWHRSHFPFPEDTPLLQTLLSGLDHYQVPSGIHRQFSLGHFLQDGKLPGFRLRIYVAPGLRNLPALRVRGFDEKKLMFVEWISDGSLCQIYQTDSGLAAFCRGSSREDFKKSWSEEITSTLPKGWEVPFPVLGEKIIVKKRDDDVFEVLFFDVVPHPSLLPRDLRESVSLHTKDALLPLDRVAVDKKGNWTVYYP